MNRQRWIIAAQLLTAPFLLFTLWASVLGIHAFFVATTSYERWIENRTPKHIWVAPVVMRERGPSPIHHYPRHWPTYTLPPEQEIHVPPGESRRLIADGYTEADFGPITLVVRSEDGTYRVRQLLYEERVVIDDLQAWELADRDVITLVQRPRRVVNFGVPVWVIITLGVLAPVSFLSIRRVRHSQSSAEREELEISCE